MPANFEPPTYKAVVADMEQLRQRGLRELPRLQLPALQAAANAAGSSSARDTRHPIEVLLREAVKLLGPGPSAHAASALLGFAPGTRALSQKDRREAAASLLGKAPGTFSKSYEAPLLEDLAYQVLELCERQAMRRLVDPLERRHPVESQLMVQWVERFEAYYRIWSPIMAIGGNLTAYGATLLEADRPFDRRPGTNGPDDEGYTQEARAQTYIPFALYEYALFEWELKQFMQQHGGLWLFSSGDTEIAVADAVYAIGWYVKFDYKLRSWLVGLIKDTKEQGMYGFLEALPSTSVGQAISTDWNTWVTGCKCRWDPPSDTKQEYFPTSAHHEGIKESCRVHQVIATCGRYCDLVDQDWPRVADWYHFDEAVKRGMTGDNLYEQWRKRTEES
jgi:hypothetical protein